MKLYGAKKLKRRRFIAYLIALVGVLWMLGWMLVLNSGDLPDKVVNQSIIELTVVFCLAAPALLSGSKASMRLDDIRDDRYAWSPEHDLDRLYMVYTRLDDLWEQSRDALVDLSSLQKTYARYEYIPESVRDDIYEAAEAAEDVVSALFRLMAVSVVHKPIPEWKDA